jgi:hypothetical protein
LGDNYIVDSGDRISNRSLERPQIFNLDLDSHIGAGLGRNFGSSVIHTAIRKPSPIGFSECSIRANSFVHYQHPYSRGRRPSPPCPLFATQQKRPTSRAIALKKPSEL